MTEKKEIKIYNCISITMILLKVLSHNVRSIGEKREIRKVGGVGDEEGMNLYS